VRFFIAEVLERNPAVIAELLNNYKRCPACMAHLIRSKSASHPQGMVAFHDWRAVLLSTSDKITVTVQVNNGANAV
jgi:hypothetical protein